MGRGRKQTPIEIKKLRGNPGRRKMPVVLKTKLVGDKNSPPAWLGAKAKEIWMQKIADNSAIKLITANDLDLLGMYCNSFARYMEAEEKSYPAVITTTTKTRLKKGWKTVEKHVKNPWVNVAKIFFEQTERVAARFGFSPVDRVKTGTILPAPQTEADEFSDYINRRGRWAKGEIVDAAPKLLKQYKDAGILDAAEHMFDDDKKVSGDNKK